MTGQEFDEFAKVIADAAPEIWSKALPRFYSELPSGNYVSLKVPAAVLSAAFLSSLSGMCGPNGKDPGVDAAVFVLGIAAQYQMPVYYVAREFMEAVMNTDIPTDIRLSDIKLPMPAATFMLPLGVLKHPEEGNVGFVSYGYHEKGEFADPLSKRTHTCIADTFIAVTSTHEQEIPPLFHMVVTSGHDVSLTLPGLSAEMQNHEFNYVSYFKGDGFVAPSDRGFNNIVTNLCLRLILAMSARPEMLERGKNTGKRLRHGLPIWTPNVVGRHYRMKREGPATGGGWHTRMHWRRGHFRNQPHGPQLSLRKTIWIEPCLISADTGKED